MNTKLLASVLVLLIVIAGGVYLISKGKPGTDATAYTQDLGMYPYTCDNGSVFNLSPLAGLTQVQVSADAQGMWTGTATLSQIATTSYAGTAPSGEQVGLMGSGETVYLVVGSEKAICNPKPDDQSAPWNWGDASAASSSGSVPGDNLALGQDVSAEYGKYLIGYNGRALYTYAKDSKNVSTCSGVCASNWPPYIVTGANLVGEFPLSAANIGTTIRADGSIQLTYGGAPLYFYAGDSADGDVKGASLAYWSLAKP